MATSSKSFKKGHTPWNKGKTGLYHPSETTRHKIGLKNKGRHHSEITRQQMKGRIPWNKGKHGLQVAWNKGHNGYTTKSKGVPKSEAHREALSEAHKGKPLSALHRKHMIGRISPMVGKHHKPETLEKLRQKRINRVFPFKDTSIERIMQQALAAEGIAFDKHVPLPGQPDLFIKPNICIFCDGDYWHHYPIGKANDPQITQDLISRGYKVLRFWEHDIHKRLDYCVAQIKEIAGLMKISTSHQG